MPKIIRCDGISIESARPIIVQRQPRSDDGASFIDEAPPVEPVVVRVPREPSEPSAEQEAEALLEQARGQAQAILEEARLQAVAEREAARHEGFDQGVAQGLQELAVIKTDALRQIDETMEDLRATRSRMIDEMEVGVVDLIFDIVDKVLSVEMKRSTEWILALVRNALSQMDSNESAVLKVSTQHYEKIAAIAAQLIMASGRDKRLRVVQEAAYPPGACVIEGDKGIIDTGVETKLDKLHRAFAGNA